MNSAEKAAQKENLRKVPVKLIKKEETPGKKDSGSNFINLNIAGINVNNQNNLNNNANYLNKEKEKHKMKELNQKINDFDNKINLGGNVLSPPVKESKDAVNNIFSKNYEMKKPSPLVSEKIKIINPTPNIIINKQKRPPSSDLEKKREFVNEEKEECVLDQMEKYYANKNLIAGLTGNDKILDSLNIKSIENAPKFCISSLGPKEKVCLLSAYLIVYYLVYCSSLGQAIII